jgi:sec-independent protein translocase protein TatA
MFDNPEKLFIILLIALFIFGPQKLIGLGASMGKAIRDFRSAVRDAHDQFSTAVAEAQKTEETFTTPEPPALLPPEPIAPVLPAASDGIPAAEPAATTQQADAGGAPAAPAPGSASRSPAEPAVEDEGPHSLASEPSSQAVLESLQRKA